jgi:tRNA(fMet)-specific endonuclease VapC
MSYLVDSDWIADWLKGRTPAVRLLSRIASDGLAISLISYGELYEGIYYGHDRQRHEQAFRQFLRPVQVVPLNRVIMRRFAIIRGQLRKQGQIVTDPDLLIAATAIEHDLTLVSRNRRHFERIPDLALYEEGPATP